MTIVTITLKHKKEILFLHEVHEYFSCGDTIIFNKPDKTLSGLFCFKDYSF
jgi:hypothetical protein